MKRIKRSLSFLLLTVLLLNATACNDRETTLAKVGLDVNIGLNAGVKTLAALNRSGLFATDTYRKILPRLEQAQTAADKLNEQLDALAILNLADKPALLAQIANLSGIVGDILTEIPETKNNADVIFYLRLAKAGLNGAAIAVAAIKIPAPPQAITVKVEEVKR